MICWKCHKIIQVEKVFRTTECPECSTDLHVCKQCKFYSAGSHFECRESVTDPVFDKEKNNFCDFFIANDDFSVALNDVKNQEARNTVAALFGEAPADSVNDSESAKKAFDSLFGD